MERISKLREELTWQNAAAVLAIYFVTLAFYRLFWHPLSRFPGPKLAAITRYYEAYFDVIHNGQYTFKIADLHKKYGPIIRISPYELHVIDPAFYEKLYRQDGRWDKYAWSYNGFSAHGSTICTASHELHRARRQPLNHFFSKANVAARQDIIDRNVIKFCGRISQFSGKIVNLGAAISALTRDIACEFTLDKTYASLDKEDFNIAVTTMLQNAGFIWRVTKHLPFFGPMMQSIPPSILSKIADTGTKAFLQYVKESEADTKNLLSIATGEKPSPRTIIHEIVDSKLPPDEKKLERVYNDMATITAAGFETTASILRLVLYHIFSNQEILRRLRAEIATVNGISSSSDAKLEVKTLEQLPYLTSVIMEGMRMSPGIGSRLARIAPDRDLFYGDLRIPAGTPVGMTTILMHTDETLYPAPLSFNPDRWMDPEARRKMDKTYAPFSRGTRICLGMYLAWAETYLIISRIVQSFDFEFKDAEAADFEMVSDQFVIGTKGNAVLNGLVALRKA
ncbi:cytochrome P450 [Hypoxylon fuscum]|nr:cytochrome P450 [Hypoxylon fuscum]